MKQCFLFFAFILFFCAAFSQGINNIWGASLGEGNANPGFLYSTTATGSNLQTRFTFPQTPNPGGSPDKTKLAEYNGKLYGLTTIGGMNNKGVIFEWDPLTNIYTKKIDFSGTANGSTPYGSLLLLNNKFYGMTSAGGTNSKGVIFEWDPATNVLIKKYDFNTLGDTPWGDLSYLNGKLYGMTRLGGSGTTGVIFEFDPLTNIYISKINFSSATGSYPQGGLTYYNGYFYGVTSRGGLNDQGVLFQWEPIGNTYLVKYVFANTSFGDYPLGSLTELNGKLYGTTYDGGTGYVGVLFEWDPVNNIYTKKIDLTASSSGRMSGDLTVRNGMLYGMTAITGIIYEWEPVSNMFTVKVNLNKPTGYNPGGTLLFSNNKFYGLTRNGGADDKGVIFEWDPNSNIYTSKIDLGGKDDQMPAGKLVPLNNKLYGVSSKGGTTGWGTIFEFDPATASYTRKISLSPANGRTPVADFIPFNNKFYGMCPYGGTDDKGVIYEWDPASNIYTKKVDLTNSTGCLPYGSPVAYNNKLYGVTSSVNGTDVGCIFEFDPATGTYTKKINFNGYSGYNPHAGLTLWNNKFYGTTLSGGPLGQGTIFEWDPAANVLSDKVDLITSTGRTSYSNLYLLNNKFYGMTYYGGDNGSGVIFEWDPAANIYITRYSFISSNGANPYGDLCLNNGKFYGVTNNGGSNSKGVIFEWDPATNVYSKKYDFGLLSTGFPYLKNDLITLPAPVVHGVAGACTAYPSVVINASNNNQWVPITDIYGNAVAEIKANGNNLGTVTTSVYINGGPVREDASHVLYLDRNVNITPQTQPSSPVDIRLYLKNAEFETLKNAVNSQGQPSGINTINDLAFFKNSAGCSSTISAPTTAVSITGSAWGSNYVLTGTISSFSSFYFMKPAAVLPVTLVNFTGYQNKNDAVLSWNTESESNIQEYSIERESGDGIFTAAGNITSGNYNTSHHYEFIDQNALATGVNKLKYRLKITENNGRFIYSYIVSLNTNKKERLVVFPNPVSDIVVMSISSVNAVRAQVVLYDIAGKNIQKMDWNLVSGQNLKSFDIKNLSKGTYYAELKTPGVSEVTRFIKE